ncbi:MAG: hypothetical protein H6810_09220 [Phycisphaeraceae bacterium]|nr:MAG: hypothetical protein H6810_09220 [Phycisphaeraceae bacterium]
MYDPTRIGVCLGEIFSNKEVRHEEDLGEVASGFTWGWGAFTVGGEARDQEGGEENRSGVDRDDEGEGWEGCQEEVDGEEGRDEEADGEKGGPDVGQKGDRAEIDPETGGPQEGYGEGRTRKGREKTDLEVCEIAGLGCGEGRR